MPKWHTLSVSMARAKRAVSRGRHSGLKLCQAFVTHDHDAKLHTCPNLRTTSRSRKPVLLSSNTCRVSGDSIQANGLHTLPGKPTRERCGPHRAAWKLSFCDNIVTLLLQSLKALLLFSFKFELVKAEGTHLRAGMFIKSLQVKIQSLAFRARVGSNGKYMFDEICVAHAGLKCQLKGFTNNSPSAARCAFAALRRHRAVAVSSSVTDLCSRV